MATFDVLLPVRNGAPFLIEALDSIVAQSFRDWRLIVLDHGSTDGSLEVAYRYAESDHRIAVRQIPEAHGLAELLNRGLEMCDCRYVLRQDADDVSMPERMEQIALRFGQDPGLALVGSQAEVIDAEGRSIRRMTMPTGRNGIAATALFRTPVAHPAVAMRLETLRQLGATYGRDFLGVLPPERQLRVPALAEDYFLFAQLAFAVRCLNVEDALVRYRWHGANVTSTRFLEQMRAALGISRNLAETLAVRLGMPHPDPAPFCNHGDQLIDVDGRSDFSEEWKALEALMRRAVPASPELERELAFRKLLAGRQRLRLAARFARFVLGYGAHPAERRTIRSWMVRGFGRHATLTLTSSGLSASR